MQNISFIRLLGIALAFSCILPVEARKETPRSANVVFIGNSITYGALHENRELTAPPVQAAQWLMQQKGVDSIFISNQGRSGRTTFDFLPQSNKMFPSVVSAANRLVKAHPDVPLLFSIMLGTNDSAERTSSSRLPAEGYFQNLCAIIDSLLARFPTACVVLNRVVFYSPSSFTVRNSNFGEEGLQHLQQYYEQYPLIVKHFEARYPGQVTMGDRKAYGYFKKHCSEVMFPEEGLKGTYYMHPTVGGAKVLGECWGKALLKRMKK